MAPLSEIPPMPPVPDDELNPSRRRPKPSKTPRTVRLDPDRSERTVVIVRSNRRLGWWLTLTCWPLYPVVYVLVSRLDIQPELLGFVLWYPPLGAAVFGMNLLFTKNYLTYDTRTGRITTGHSRVQRAIDSWNEGDLIEYSVHFAELRIARPTGKRRRLVKSSFMLDRDSWTAFVDVFLANQNARAAARRDADADA